MSGYKHEEWVERGIEDLSKFLYRVMVSEEFVKLRKDFIRNLLMQFYEEMIERHKEKK